MYMKRRWYQDSYLDYGFTYLVKDGAHIPQRVVCLKTFSNSIMKPFQLKQHLANAHPQLKDKNRSFFEVAKAKKPHTISESLLKPCIVDSLRLMLGGKSSQKMKQILSNNTIKNRIAEMSEDIKENVVSKQKLPDLKGTHCLIHREALASKTVPKNLHDALTVIINIVNYVKGSALKTRLFRELCRDTALLFHTQVRWLSKGNMLARVFELREEIKLFLSYSNKVDLLSAFNKEGFVVQMAYLADIFETLNELNKKLRGQRSNVIVHTDTINAFFHG
ncbi:general transcription factor II-I repeat domain-containing protein 2-like [Portunus trituberculatus]|uniref:general transcription factor II-I repeat domain-containing protein 2-like n=1 Tax=Portunus trituberculatus TaxID=210409 RepID=UPI001E1CB29B|nr:general transcription factor II-I repeat domain-containing protein 2-like [Portunus trituberculatus]